MRSDYFGLQKKPINLNNCWVFRSQGCIAHKISLELKLIVVMKDLA